MTGFSSTAVPEPLQPRTLIGTGFTAEVFAAGEGRVLKLFLPWVERVTAEREFVRSQAVHAAGSPSPATYELVQIGNRYGIVFERVQGDSMVRSEERRVGKE